MRRKSGKRRIGVMGGLDGRILGRYLRVEGGGVGGPRKPGFLAWELGHFKSFVGYQGYPMPPGCRFFVPTPTQRVKTFSFLLKGLQRAHHCPVDPGQSIIQKKKKPKERTRNKKKLTQNELVARGTNP